MHFALHCACTNTAIYKLPVKILTPALDSFAVFRGLSMTKNIKIHEHDRHFTIAKRDIGIHEFPMSSL